MKNAYRRFLPATLLCVGLVGPSSGQPLPPRIDSVMLAKQQPAATDQAVIWYDSFDGSDETQRVYLEPKTDSPHAKRSTSQALGGVGRSMECFYPKGEKGIGNRKLVFGDCPFGKPLRRGERFEELYWRLYVKHQSGWQGGSPAKLSRAIGFVSGRWNQAFILHVWGSGLSLTLDPVSGVRGDRVVTTKYNDFGNFKWLGNSPKGKFPLHATEESGRWVCVESWLKLNTPGQRDGRAALWVDGRLDAERFNMNFRGSYTEHTINALFLEAYWNQGSPVDQYRWYDDFIVSTKPIGPLTAERNPTLIRADRPCQAWETEIAADPEGREVVWRSHTLAGTSLPVTVAAETGVFSRKGQSMLSPGPTYFCRLRQRNNEGQWTPWTGWHQPFRVAER